MNTHQPVPRAGTDENTPDYGLALCEHCSYQIRHICSPLGEWRWQHTAIPAPKGTPRPARTRGTTATLVATTPPITRTTGSRAAEAAKLTAGTLIFLVICLPIAVMVIGGTLYWVFTGLAPFLAWLVGPGIVIGAILVLLAGLERVRGKR